MPVRRRTDPIWVQQIWDAIRFITHQRQQPDMSRLTRYMQRTWDYSFSETELHIRELLQDKLLISENKTGQKGSKVGLVTECFKIPSLDDSTPVDDGHDWYCIECHLAGDVINCASCHRVFHLECYNKRDLKVEKENRKINDDVEIIEENSSSNKDVDVIEVINENDVTSSGTQKNPISCSVCHLLQNEDKCVMGKEELNYLLNFTLNRIKVWLPPNITDTMAPRTPKPWINEQELRWRANQLLYQTMDIRIMEMKLRTKEYTKLVQLHADVNTIQHNVAIFHGIDSQEMDSSKLMLQDCVYDLVEIAQCVDCYRHSNEKSSSSWFCIPCNPPHQLVWAKQKGYCYWPAKVIKQINDQYDVRFFGAKHLRSVVDKTFIKPIDTSIQSLQVKRSNAFNKSVQELELHKKLLANPDEVAKLLVTAELKLQEGVDNSYLSEVTKKKAKIKKQTNISRDSDSEMNITDSPCFNKEPVHKAKPKSKTKVKKVKKKQKKSQRVAKKPIDVTEEPIDVTNETAENEVSNDKICDVIDLSDGESKSMSPSCESRHDFVSSSTEKISSQPTLTVEKTLRTTRSRRGSNNTCQQLDRSYSDSVEKLRRLLENISNRDEMIKISLDCMQQELDRVQNAQAEHLRTIVDAHNVHISEIKKKQWCYNCEQEAIYHCCWNTAYCSIACQQQHWQMEHKKVCKRKR